MTDITKPAGTTLVCTRCKRMQQCPDPVARVGKGIFARWAEFMITTSPTRMGILCPWCVSVINRVLDVTVAVAEPQDRAVAE